MASANKPQFQITNKVLGYVTKPDPTSISTSYLVAGSQNVESNDGFRVSSRKGYTLLGAASSGTAYPIISSYEWKTNRGVEHALRRYNDTLQVLYGTTWYTIKTSLAITGVNRVHTNFAEIWEPTERIDFLLFTDGTSTIFDWTGAVVEVASNTATTITIASSTWAAAGFLLSGTRSVIINGVEYTYTGGEASDTLTGLSGLPALAVGTPVFQATRSHAISTFLTTNISIPSDYNIDLIETLNNQVYIGAENSREVYMSRTGSITGFNRSSPRITGEAEKFILDASTRAFVAQEDVMYMGSGDDFWFATLFNPSADNTTEQAQIKRLKTQTQKGALTQSAVGKMINDIAYVSAEPTFDTLGRVTNITTPQTTPLSDPISPDFDAMDFSNCHVKYFKNKVYIAIPAENRVYIWNVDQKYWEAPHILPIRRLGIVGGRLIGHSSQQQETYYLYDGYNDNGASAQHIAKLAYDNGGDRTKEKTFDEYYVETYQTLGTDLNCTLNFELNGSDTTVEFNIPTDNPAIVFGSATDTGLGSEVLGSESLSGGGGDSEEPLVKIRAIKEMVPRKYFEYQRVFSTDGVDQRWEIIASGPNASISQDEPSHIKF